MARGWALAAEMLGVAEDEIDFAEDGFRASGSFAPSAVTFPNGCHMCEFESDPETGACRFVDYVVVEGIGTVGLPRAWDRRSANAWSTTRRVASF